MRVESPLLKFMFSFHTHKEELLHHLDDSSGEWGHFHSKMHYNVLQYRIFNFHCMLFPSIINIAHCTYFLRHLKTTMPQVIINDDKHTVQNLPESNK